MANAAQIKSWVMELRTVKPVSADAILVFPGPHATRITLLDTACCIPALTIEKNIEHIEREDLARLSQWINHQH